MPRGNQVTRQWKLIQDAEVLEPASLREEIRTEAEALLRRLEVSDALKEISAEQLTLPVVGAV